jgi:hypothetical protein
VYGFGRILEDVLETIGDAELLSRYRPLAAVCVGSDEARPADGLSLVTRIRAEAGRR